MKHLWMMGCLIAVLGCKQQQNAAPPAQSASSSSATPITTTESAVAPEVSPVGDIPDSQAFVKFKSDGGGFEVEVPEGWARTVNGAEVTFVNKLDGVRVVVTPSPTAPTAATARDREAKQLEQSGRAVKITGIDEVKLPSGPVVRIKYTSNSEPNPVTNKQVRLENETYLYFKNGKTAALTVWAPQGADNADQWARMSKSFRWM
jgi:hypothetical protein